MPWPMAHGLQRGLPGIPATSTPCLRRLARPTNALGRSRSVAQDGCICMRARDKRGEKRNQKKSRGARETSRQRNDGHAKHLHVPLSVLFLPGDPCGLTGAPFIMAWIAFLPVPASLSLALCLWLSLNPPGSPCRPALSASPSLPARETAILSISLTPLSPRRPLLLLFLQGCRCSRSSPLTPSHTPPNPFHPRLSRYTQKPAPVVALLSTASVSSIRRTSCS